MAFPTVGATGRARISTRRTAGDVIGRRLGHYLVLERLGGGGMGDVFVAEDTRLRRRVALKLPRPEVAESLDIRARFQHEARAAAALNHPNIVHVYSVEESEELLFITMELVQGRSLHEVLRAETPLPIPRMLAFATQIAEGVACAHAAGVVHRDLTPGNVIVSDDDRVKILDFGLAKLFTPLSPWGTEAATMAREAPSTGMTLGTAGYMSPEQALGKTLDPRTDVFSLGVVLFEMATGRAPFEGTTLAAVFDQLLHRQPPSPQTLNPAVPTDLAAIIARALEKDPGLRYESANELLQDLRRVALPGTHGVTPPPRSTPSSSIVVLPFVDMSPQKDQEYLCHGVAEEIISSLTSVPGLHVISRTSAFAFQGKDLEITEIGRRLKVGTALEGSVRKAGDRVRVTAQLVDTESGHQLWSRRFDRELADVFAIQDEIADTIVHELRSGMTIAPARKRSKLHVDVHDAYLQGMYAQNKWTDQSMRQAIGHFRNAIALDSGFAPAYAALAEAHVWLYSGVGIVPASGSIPHARWAVEKALDLDPALADAHKVQALIAMNHDWDRKRAEQGLTRALELSPGSAAAHLWNAWRLALLERQHDRALIELGEAERLDPLDLQVKTQIGYVHHFHHDLARAIEQFERVVALEPSFAFGHYALGDACTQSGQYDRAFAEYEQAIALGGRSVNQVAALGYAYGRSGRHDQARALLEELTARAAQSHVSPMWIALIHLGLLDLDRLFRWMDRALDERDGSLILITAAVEFDPVREDARFKSLLEQMGLGDLASPTA
jgi:serine/threonine protein kinase/tetratricopeptide (TPR) repeat protein